MIAMKKILAFLKTRWLAILIVAVGISATISYQHWLPPVKQFITTLANPSDDEPADQGQDAHAGHDHADDEAHDDSNTLELSDVAWKNIGLRTAIVKPQTYIKTISVPAMVVERPGRSQVEISAPLTGMVTRIYPIEGEAIQPGQPLFDLRLTHEDLVTAQRDFLQSAQELEVIRREIERLESVGEGVIAGRRVLEHKYEQEKIEGALHAQHQALLLHGLSEHQVDEILATRRLLPMLTVTAPPFDENADHHDHDVQHLYHVQSILVKRGQSLAAGQALALLADHCLLYVEGQAFDDDAQRLTQATRDSWLIDVSTVVDGRQAVETIQLTVFYIADHVEPESRALRFYLSLPNRLDRDDEQGGRRFVTWHFRPGQRMEVKIPIGEPWSDQIVLPPEAVVTEGADVFVFEQEGDHFHRVAVHVLYRDKDAVVIENDGSLIGATLAMSGAYQMHLAIKNKLGGGVDPHAGHSH
jgi:multidrug efflux pump subunit AcrA (membrane-fusion protein)